jgi:hypothetical protein
MRELRDEELDIVAGGLGKPEVRDPWPVDIGGGALLDEVSVVLRGSANGGLASRFDGIAVLLIGQSAFLKP